MLMIAVHFQDVPLKILPPGSYNVPREPLGCLAWFGWFAVGALAFVALAMLASA